MIETRVRMEMVEDLLGNYFLRLRIPRLKSGLAVLFVCLAAFGFGAPAARAASFTASLDRDTITLGEQATLSLTFEGGQSKNVPTPHVPGLQFVNTGNSQNFSIINGAMSSTVTVTFSVTARQAGVFTIPALTADVSGQRLSTTPLKLTVTTASAPSAAAINSGSEVAILKFVFPKSKIYVGEPGVGRLDLYLRDDVQNFGNFQLTSSPADGFSAGKAAELQNQRRRVQVGNRVYTVIPLAVPLTAVRAGALTLGPFTASAVVVVPSQNDGGDPFFRQFFNQGEQKQVLLATDPVSVESLPLPEQNKPANFTGAVGDFTMTATAGPTNVTAGDPITVRVQISGRGALDAVTLPPLDAWRDFKTYPPTTKFEPGDQFGFQGTKTFEQIISPQNSDVHELPALTFSFFNPDDGQYHTLTQAAVPLTVKPAGASPMPTLAANKNAAPENQTPQDILPIKEKPGTIATKSSPLVTQPAFLAAQAVPALAFLAAFVWRKRADHLANNPRLRRQRAVAALVASGMDDLKKYAAENKPDEFFATLFRLLQEQLGERLDCPASAITENVIDEHAVLRGAPKTTLDALRELFQLCNQARYAPVRGASELNSVAAKFEKTVGELQEVKA
ncbi:MAG: BatD family protein [Verrucomicrobiota bacterium]